MTKKRHQRHHARRGVVVVLVAIMIVLLFAMVAFSVDYGLMIKIRSDMQRAADAAALAAVQDLIPAADGTQDLQSARGTVRDYVTSNLENASFNVEDGDIQIGRFDTSTIYSKVTLLDSGLFDAVRVTLRRDGVVNPRVSLFFARALGIQDASIAVMATAVLQKPSSLGPGAEILPFSIPKKFWDTQNPGDEWSIYGDGKIEDGRGKRQPGNWGTVDIGSTSNGTSDLSDQMINGLRQNDLDTLHADKRIPRRTEINASEPLWVQADPGLSSGLKSAVRQNHGTPKVVPIYDQVSSGGGNNLEFHVVGWGVVTIVDSHWHGGAKKTYVKVQKSYMYAGGLGASSRLDSTGLIGGAFTSPVLVE